MLPACAPGPQDCARVDVFCVGLVTASGTITEGINREAWLGLQDARSDGLTDRIDYIETVDSRDRVKNITVLAEDGYDLIITVGFAMSDATAAAAQEYPHSNFIGIEQAQTTKLPNLVELAFHEDQGGFLAGALAALISQTHHVAAVCEANFVDSVRRYCDGYQAGARYAASNTLVTVVYRDGPTEDLFNDAQWGNTTALQVVADGADVVFAAGGGTAQAALESAAGQDIPVIGSETDAFTDLPNIRPMVVSSAVDDIRSGVLDLIRMSRTGQFPAGEFFGQTRLAPFYDQERQIPENVKAELANIQQGLTDGSIRSGIP